LGAAPFAGIVAIAGISSCRAPRGDKGAAGVVDTIVDEGAHPFVLRTTVSDPAARSAAVETLRRASELLLELGFERPASALTIELYASDEERLAATGEMDPASPARANPNRNAGETYPIVPASASRTSLRAAVAFPRREVARSFDGAELCDSTRIALAHEAAHLWLFAQGSGEERVPEAIHEGIAEWVADQMQQFFESPRRLSPEANRGAGARCSEAFLRESAVELWHASEKGALPSPAELLRRAPRDFASPQLATAAAWAWIAGALADPAQRKNARVWFEQVAGGEDPERAMESNFGARESWHWLAELRTAAPPGGWWAMGRDATALRGGGFLLSPVPGKNLWVFQREGGDCHNFEFEAEVECLGGAMPELWIGFGFDDGRNGARAVIPASGIAAVEAVRDAMPQYGNTADLSPGAFPKHQPRRIRIVRRGRDVSFFVGFAPVTIRVPDNANADFGRIGIGARGGVFAVRDLAITRGGGR
jgi:hypothetical protein